ncbi:MAG: hypothetical protein JKY60_17200 [Kordiimonadaceae bacterium]|nr:hypothetical protein [Kordiimonadaceae bacterium]
MRALPISFIRSVLAICAVCAWFLVPAADVSAQGAGTWDVSFKDVRKLERRLKLPKGAMAVRKYDRTYIGIFQNGRKVVYGLLVKRKARKATVTIIDAWEDLPEFEMEKRCDQVGLYWNVESNRPLLVTCEVDP